MNTKANSVREQKTDTLQTQTPAVQVTQAELVKYIGLKNSITKLTEEKELLETELKNLLTHGATVEDGVHIARTDISERRTPSWKDAFVELGDKLKGAGQGEKLAAKVIENTEPVTSIRLTVK